MRSCSAVQVGSSQLPGLSTKEVRPAVVGAPRLELATFRIWLYTDEGDASWVEWCAGLEEYPGGDRDGEADRLFDGQD